ncbi:MAG: DHH family phosphoesterase, partial [Chloroflexota bacterium]|nr:DHH family phosphoesterase [Chloroflexota bacterium]
MNDTERLSLSGRRWRIAPRLSPEDLGAVTDLPPLAVQLLHNRGLRGAEAIGEFVAGGMPPHDPFLMDGMEAAAGRLLRAVAGGERVCIYSDYDADGVTSCSVLTLMLRSLGLDPIAYFPDRRREGYGPNVEAMLGLREKGASVVVTVDCGTGAHEALAAAADAGLDVIVVDHHVAEAKLPRAVAVINPNRLDESGAHGELAAVGVAYLLVVGLNRALRQAGWFSRQAEPDLLPWLDLVALGTICDVAPLTGVNRALVAQGLKVMARRGNVGLK